MDAYGGPRDNWNKTLEERRWGGEENIVWVLCSNSMDAAKTTYYRYCMSKILQESSFHQEGWCKNHKEDMYQGSFRTKRLVQHGHEYGHVLCTGVMDKLRWIVKIRKWIKNGSKINKSATMDWHVGLQRIFLCIWYFDILILATVPLALPPAVFRG